MTSAPVPQPSPIVVLGAGIIGLTTAVRLLESDLVRTNCIPVHILADHLPNDPLDATYASTIAGAHHLSFADDEDGRQARWDRRTFAVMYDEWRQEGEKTGLMLLKQTEFYVGTNKHLKIYEEHPDFTIHSVPDMSLPFPADHSIAFTSLTMTPLTYLDRLCARISSLGGNIHRLHLPSLSHLSHPSVTSVIGSQPPQAIIVCAGLGALTLGGVEDSTVYPTRGQIVKVHAPWVRSGWTRQVGSLNGGEGGERTYVIPRPDGEVVLGGTREERDWYPYPRNETSVDILRRALEICPQLRPTHQFAPALKSAFSARAVPDMDTLSLDVDSQPNGHVEDPRTPLEDLVIQHLVGFRPSRRDGVRLEYGEDLSLEGGLIKVVYNYGHGGAGWQSCWGTAEDAADLVLQSLVH